MTTARMVRCFAIGSLLGRPDSDEIVDHGMRYLWNNHRDRKNGGYVWSLDDSGHPDADRMIADGTDIIENRF